MGALTPQGGHGRSGAGTDARRQATPAGSLPEALMRSRYTAFVRLDAPYLLRTWHPRTRPAEPLDLVRPCRRARRAAVEVTRKCSTRLLLQHHHRQEEVVPDRDELEQED
ncbi:YchJ family metal-binding protein, partial [Streptomyces sp. Agncl-13]|uniref:YchJ family metal-binding protein n=1 Tax=Streptomyces sp. Agncl-13 TaxID=3400628 RepID=UPI003A860E21